MLKPAHCLASIALITAPCLATSVSAHPHCYRPTLVDRQFESGSICSHKTFAANTQRSGSALPSSIAWDESSKNKDSDYLVDQGYQGRWRYEIWSNKNNTRYTLKVWKAADDPNTYPRTHGGFSSHGEALKYLRSLT